MRSACSGHVRVVINVKKKIKHGCLKRDVTRRSEASEGKERDFI